MMALKTMFSSDSRRINEIFSLPNQYVVSFILIHLMNVVLVSGMTMTYDIPLSGMECLYEKLEADEYATMSVFISSGAELRGLAKFEGPVAPASVTTTSDLHNSAQRFSRGERFTTGGKVMDRSRIKDGFDSRGNILVSEQVDFEHITDDQYLIDDDMIYHRNRFAGEANQKTFHIIVPGWYRACVIGSWYQISAEIELRKSSDLGYDENTKHVVTYHEHALREDEAEIDADAAKEEDLQTAKTQIRTLHRILGNIRDKQENERRRLEVHKATNDHSHSRMVLNSLMETVLFMVVTGFQVYTIRQWFQGSPMLG